MDQLKSDRPKIQTRTSEQNMPTYTAMRAAQRVASLAQQSEQAEKMEQQSRSKSQFFGQTSKNAAGKERFFEDEEERKI